jgi:cytochrome bd-type quinol oxidase subunit 2
VWLVAAGGALFFAFPRLYASAFSGFYLSLMIVLWLLILRGISIELRNHVDNPLWRSLWGTVFGDNSRSKVPAFRLSVRSGFSHVQSHLVPQSPRSSALHLLSEVGEDIT